MAQRAVLVGINYYNTSKELKGCINDVYRIADILRSVYGFPNSNIVIMVDNLPKTSPYYPTRENILRELGALRTATQPGDVAMFHYSGHGIVINSSKSTNVEYSNDNALIPTDVFGGSNFDLSKKILDDQLWDWASGFPAGSTVFAIIDACYSGSALDLPYSIKTEGGRSNKFTVSRVETRPDTAAKVIMLSGARDDQMSLDTYDASNKPIGALTYAFCSYILNNPTKPVSYLDLLTSVRAYIVKRNGSPNQKGDGANDTIQEPQVSLGRFEDSNTQFTLAAPKNVRAITFDDTVLRELLATLENPPATQRPPPPPSAPAPAPVPTPAPPVRRQSMRPIGGLQAALVARKR